MFSINEARMNSFNATKDLKLIKDFMHFKVFRGSQSYFSFLFLLPFNVAFFFIFSSISCSFPTDRLFWMCNNLLNISSFLSCTINLKTHGISIPYPLPWLMPFPTTWTCALLPFFVKKWWIIPVPCFNLLAIAPQLVHFQQHPHNFSIIVMLIVQFMY